MADRRAAPAHAARSLCGPTALPAVAGGQGRGPPSRAPLARAGSARGLRDGPARGGPTATGRSRGGARQTTCARLVASNAPLGAVQRAWPCKKAALGDPFAAGGTAHQAAMHAEHVALAAAASRKGRQDVLEWLLDSARPDAGAGNDCLPSNADSSADCAWLSLPDGDNCVHVAAAAGQCGVLSMLAAKLPLDAWRRLVAARRPVDGATALAAAVLARRAEASHLLLQLGADPNTVTGTRPSSMVPLVGSSLLLPTPQLEPSSLTLAPTHSAVSPLSSRACVAARHLVCWPSPFRHWR